MNRYPDAGLGKVPQVTLAFWVIKVAATTLGETGGDALSMTPRLGYAISTLIFFAVFVVAVAAQIRAKAFHPWLYWAVIVATTTVGTTMADRADRSLGIGYVGGSLILFALLMIVLGAWWLSVGSVSVAIAAPKVESFYWLTILFSNTLGAALGDFLADSSGLGYEGAAVVFAGGLALLAIAYFYTRVFPHLVVLGGVHLDPPARRHGRRYPHQAPCQRRSRSRPDQFLGDHRDLHDRLHFLHLATSRRPSRRTRAKPLKGGRNQFRVRACWRGVEKDPKVSEAARLLKTKHRVDALPLAKGGAEVKRLR
jgi:uncharacterized membrane-anchored protein